MRTAGRFELSDEPPIAELLACHRSQREECEAPGREWEWLAAFLYNNS
jgi:hypothetical protein